MDEQHNISIADTGESFLCDDEKNILKAMEKAGCKGIAVGCRGGGCGVCRIKVIHGSYLCKRMSREHISTDDEAQGIVLACRTIPLSDLELQVLGKLPQAVVKTKD